MASLADADRTLGPATPSWVQSQLMIAVVFPGQGSQKPGMGADLVSGSAAARASFDVVSEAVGFDVLSLCSESDEETLRRTENAQVALYACGVAAWSALQPVLNIAPAAFAGHSVGEYAALACSGVLSVADGARLVRRRGEIMALSGSERMGTMAAVLGLERADLDAVCAEASGADGVVVVANDNCPGQLVISGDVVAVTRASQLASDRGAKRVLPLNVSGAFHSPLMDQAASQMRAALNEVHWSAASAPVVSNVTATPITDPTMWPDLLERQLKSPVRWTESVQAMLGQGVDAFVECGSGEVLCGLIRRIHREARTVAVQDLSGLEAASSLLAGVA